MAIDRRLGDFFTIEIDNSGHVWGGYSDTAEGGATALPGFIHQSGGPVFVKQRASDQGGNDQGSVGTGNDSGETQNDGDEVSAGGAEQDAGDSQAATEARAPSALAATGLMIMRFVTVAAGLILLGWFIKRRSATKA